MLTMRDESDADTAVTVTQRLKLSKVASFLR